MTCQHLISINLRLTLPHFIGKVPFMDKKAAFDALLSRCFAARITPSQLCVKAKVSPANITHWRTNPDRMRADTLGRLEDALAIGEKERTQ